MKNIINYIHTSELTTMDGYNDCIDGVASRCEPDGTIREFVVYDTSKIINKLMKDGMTHSEAIDFFEYNQSHTFLSDDMPAFLRKS